MNLSTINIRPLATLVLVVASASTLADQPAQRLAFDIAEDGTRFVYDQEHLFEDGLPAYGNVFTTQGYIYPAGTLTCTEDGCDGVLEDGSPEFPDRVLGEWSCWGTHVGDGARTETGPWVLTTQQFSFGPEFGEHTIMSSGYEVVDIDAPVKRAIAGGTGAFIGATGEQVQKLKGFNPSFGVGLTVKLRMRVSNP